MKSKLILILLFTFSCKNQNTIDAYLELRGCVDPNTFFSLSTIQKVKFYDKEGNSIETNWEYIPEQFETWKGEFSEEGYYAIEFENIFGQSQDTIIRLDSINNKISLCLDNYQDQTTSLFIDNLIEGGPSWNLSTSFVGCFDRGELDVQVFKAKDQYKVRYRSWDRLLHNDWVEKRLNEEQLDKLKRFEGKVRLMHNPHYGCTTTQDFIISYNGTVVKIIDSSCSWPGYEEIIDILKIENNIPFP